MTKVFSYSRISTPEQELGHGLQRQDELAHAYVQRMNADGAGWRLQSMTHKGSAYDAGNMRTGALARFLEEIEADPTLKGSILLVESIDRLTRQNSWDSGGLLRRIIDRGIAVHTLSPEKVYSLETLRANPFLEVELLVIAMRSNEESKIKEDRLRSSWNHKRKNAGTKKMTSRGPSWLVYDKDTDSFTLDPVKAPIVERIYRDFASGIGTHSIAANLNAEEVPVFGDGKGTRKGLMWHRSFVHKLLNSTAVIGTVEPHSVRKIGGLKVRTRIDSATVHNYYPAAIDDALYQQVRAIQQGPDRSPRRGMHATSPVANIMGGIARCALCGGSMRRVSKTAKRDIEKGHKQWVYLVCSKAHTKAGCLYRTVPYAKIEQAFLEALPYILSDAPAGERQAAIDEKLRGIVDNLYRLQDSIDDAVKRVRGRKPGAEATLQKLEAALAHELKRQRRWEALRASSSDVLVTRRLQELEQACAQEPLDRTRVNVSMRAVFSAIEVDTESRQFAAFFKMGGSTQPFTYDPDFVPDHGFVDETGS